MISNGDRVRVAGANRAGVIEAVAFENITKDYRIKPSVLNTQIAMLVGLLIMVVFGLFLVATAFGAISHALTGTASAASAWFALGVPALFLGLGGLIYRQGRFNHRSLQALGDGSAHTAQSPVITAPEQAAVPMATRKRKARRSESDLWE
ncbi:hypothetical protein [Salinisphaera dokdonensis]